MLPKKIIAFCILFFLSYAVSAFPIIAVTGKISTGKSPVANVSVTDGVTIVQTDKHGNYFLHTHEGRKFIYYSLPSGYESPVEKNIPIFYKPLAPGKQQQVINFTLHRSKQSQVNHSFIVWADPQVLDTSEVNKLREVANDVRETVKKISHTLPTHGLSCGDLVFDRMNLFEHYKDVVSTINIPFYQSLGNHDMDYNERSDELSAGSYSGHFGPVYYSFNKGKIHYVTLKNVFYYGFSYRYMGYINEEQLNWLEQDLSQVAKGSTVVLTMHIPSIYGESPEPDSYAALLSNSVMNKKALYEILKQYKVHLLAGHSHTQWNKQVAPNIMEHVHAAASGAWWQGDVSVDGTPKGYTVYLVYGDSISWYYKPVGKDKTEQLKVYKPGTDISQQEYFIANVYNYDDTWKVNWYENGKLKGAMERYWGYDPLARELYQPGKNNKHAWLSAAQTYHLFRARPKDTHAAISVKVIDRFGNIYLQNL